ncbi:MAG: hypothetical protein WCG67_06980, partial [Ferruginibacter sp.]
QINTRETKKIVPFIFVKPVSQNAIGAVKNIMAAVIAITSRIPVKIFEDGLSIVIFIQLMVK